MRVSEHEQRTEGWFAERLGKPTASNFHRIITPTGKSAAGADTYINELVAELITGKSVPVPVTEAMQRGTDLEPEARDVYKLITGQDVFEIGLCLHDDLDCGASPDGLVGDDGLLEIKCPIASTMVGYLRDGDDKLPSKYIPQCQGQLWITGRKWLDFVAYHPDMRIVMARVERDEAYIELLEEYVAAVCKTIKKASKNFRSL